MSVQAWRAWIVAARPRTLVASVVPVAVGAACAGATGRLRVGPAVAALAGAVLIQIGTNFANDVYDFLQGADTAARVGPPRATQSGLLSAATVRAGMIAAFALAGACGAYLSLAAGWPIVAIGLASIAAGWSYTARPLALGYRGLGDALVFAFFGLAAVCGTAFAAGGAVPRLAVLASVPVGALATALLVVNNVRDVEGDARAGKRTLVVRLGRRAGVVEYALLLALAYAAVGPIARERPFSLLALATLPLGAGAVRALAHAAGGPAHNRCLSVTAGLLGATGLLLAAGIAMPP